MKFVQEIKALLLCLIIVFCSLANQSYAQSRNLNFYVSAALANSPLLKDFNNQISSNIIDSQRLRATFKPQVSGIASNSLAPVLQGFGYDPALSNIASFSDVVNVNKTFIGKKNINEQSKSFTILNDSVKIAQKLSEQELKRSITTQYLTTYGDWQQLNFNADIIKLLKTQEEILRKLTESNIYRQTDYLTFLVTLKQTELQLKQLNIQFRNNLSTLNYLAGIFDTSLVTLDAPEIQLEQLPNARSSSWFMHYINDSLAMVNNLNIMNYSYKPKLSTFANAGYSSSFLYQAYKNFGYSVGMNLVVPIYDGHQKQMQQHKIALAQNTNTLYRDYFTTQYNQQIAILRQQLSGTESLINDINEQIKYADGLIEANNKLLETGDARIPDLVIAINNYLSAKNLLTQNNISRMQIITQLNYWNR